jgi:branched-chain amino acid transport system substrate-binding protein
VLPWAATRLSTSQHSFNREYQRATAQLPDAFAALGYDSARLIDHAQRLLPPAARRYDLLDALQQVRFDGPRGALHVDARTNTVVTPLYLREVQRHGTALTHAALRELTPIAADDPRLQPLRSGIKTGWLQPYLIA